MNETLTNIVTIARREFLWRGRGKTYIVTTILLVIVAFVVALAPVVVRYISQQSGPERIGLYTGTVSTAISPTVILDRVLNTSIGSTTTDGTKTDKPAYSIAVVTDLAAARQDVMAGKFSAVLALSRATNGDLAFQLYTEAASFERSPQLIQQAANSLAVQDRLDRLGVKPSDQQTVFAAPSFGVQKADPATTDKPKGPDSVTEFVGNYVVGFALTLFIFMSIMLYGQWVAMSVAEEKNSRVMELVLGAATPFQLLTGKVIGVGALGLLQYVVVFVPASLAIVFQDRIAALVLGGNATGELPQGLTIDLLFVFGVMFVLGFALYACLYAGAASMVSRQEDINQMVAPLTLLSTAGYMIAAYAGSGLIDLTSPLMRALSLFPLLSPYLILTRMGLKEIGPLEVALAIAILLATIVAALWFAARIYRVGVLMYGQRPGFRAMIRAFRAAGT